MRRDHEAQAEREVAAAGQIYDALGLRMDGMCVRCEAEEVAGDALMCAACRSECEAARTAVEQRECEARRKPARRHPQTGLPIRVRRKR